MFPIGRRASQPPAVNDLMKGNVGTLKSAPRMDRAAWGADLERIGLPLP